MRKHLFLAILITAITGTISQANALEHAGRWFKHNGQFVWLNGVDWQSVVAQKPGATTGWDGNYTRVLDELRNARISKIRLWADCWFFNGDVSYQPWAKANGKWNLDQFDAAYWTRLKDFVQKAKDRGIFVEYCLFTEYPNADQWKFGANAYNKDLNSNGAFPANSAGHGLPEFYTNWNGLRTTTGHDLQYYQYALLDKAVAELSSFDNVYYEVHNEPPNAYAAYWPWSKAIAAYLYTTKGKLVNCESSDIGFPPQASGTGMPNYWDDPNVDMLDYHITNTNPNAISKFWHGAQLKNKPLSVNESYYWNENASSLPGVTREAWGNTVSGVYYAFYQKDIHLFKIGDTEWNSKFKPLATAIRSVMDSLRFWEMSAVDAAGNEYDNLVLSKSAADTNHQVFCKPGSQYLAYFWGANLGASVTMNLAAGSYKHKWVYALNGTVLKSGTVNGSSAASIPAPTGYDVSYGALLVINNAVAQPSINPFRPNSRAVPGWAKNRNGPVTFYLADGRREQESPNRRPTGVIIRTVPGNPAKLEKVFLEN